MKRSAEWHRAQSKAAELAYQRAYWQPGADVTLKRVAPAPVPAQSAAQGLAKALYPNHDSALRQSEIVRRDAPQGSTASRIYPHLPREGGK